MFGGNDSYNMLVPRSAAEYNVYAASRQNLAIDQIDLGAPFLEPQAELLTRAVQAGFAFEGSNTPIDFEPQPKAFVRRVFIGFQHNV